MTHMTSIETIIFSIEQSKAELDTLRQSLDNFTIKEALQTEFLYESNRIEGNTLTLRETHLVINEGMTISGKSMREHLEAINHREAILFIQDIVNKKVHFSEYVLKQIHAIVLYGIDRDNAGVYRKLPVAIAGTKHIPTPPYLLQDLMEDYFRFYDQHHDKLHPVILAAEMHQSLVTIHPFIDGNGRISRLIMNLILLQHGFPLAIIGGDYESRMAYYDALEKVQTNNQDFILLIAEKVLFALQRYIHILNHS